jgi:hypothetical protein
VSTSAADLNIRARTRPTPRSGARRRSASDAAREAEPAAPARLRPDRGRQLLTPQPGPKRRAYPVSAFDVLPDDDEGSPRPSPQHTLPA